MHVRPATSDDVIWLVDQMRAFDQFFGATRSLFPDVPQAIEIVEQLVAQHPFWVAESAKGLVGFIAGALTPHPYNPSITVLSELFWWVDEQERGSRAGALLLAAFITFGEQHADWIVMTLEEASPVNPATLERRGFKPYERSYLREVA